MAKSKTFRTLYTDEKGNEYIFDAKKFKRCMDKKVHEIIKCKMCTTTSSARGKARKDLATFLGCYPDEAALGKIKNWESGNNGPSDPQDVKKMEEYFGTELLTIKHTKKETTTEAIEISENERNAAREVYTIICDLIRVHQKLMFNYACADCPDSFLSQDHSYIPENYPVYADIANEIRKRSLDIPRAVRDEALEMVYDIYGPWDAERENEGDYPSLDGENEDFRLYSGADVHANNQLNFLGWLEFSYEQTEGYYEQLDEIFEKYIN